MTQIDVQIMGQSYVLGCPEGGEAALREAVDRVDAAMSKIRDAGKVKARDRIAVLASLNLAFELAQLESAQAVRAAPDVSPADSVAGSADPRLTQLVHRLDHALADGHLL
jgi:cell division protein ZapA